MLKTKTKNQTFKTTGIVCATALALCLYAPRAEAFGGLGILGHKSSHKGGVNAIGVHIDTNSTQQPDIDIRTCDSETEELVGTECLPKCPEGLERNTDNSCTVCANKNVYLSYMDDPCGTDTPMTGNCKSNKDCALGEFCNLISSAGDYTKPDTGTCTPLGNSETITYHDQTFLKSENAFTWWASENWCKAQGKTMVSYTDFGITFSGDWCAGDELHPIDEEDGETCGGIIWSEFSSVFGSDDIWLSDRGPEIEYSFGIHGYGDSGSVEYGAECYGRSMPDGDVSVICK